MSSAAFIDINLKPSFKIDVVAAIEALIEYGWELNDGSNVGYLPLGDGDSFHWKFVSLEKKSEVLKELRMKQNTNEIIGITISLKNSNAGANLLYIPNERQISLSLSDSTKLANGINNFELYEKSLLPWVLGEKIEFESINFMQTDSGGQIEFEKRVLEDELG